MLEIRLFYVPLYTDGGQKLVYSTNVRHGCYVPTHEGKPALNYVGPSLDSMVARLALELSGTQDDVRLVGNVPKETYGQLNSSQFEPLGLSTVGQVKGAVLQTVKASSVPR